MMNEWQKYLISCHDVLLIIIRYFLIVRIPFLDYQMKNWTEKH